MESVTQVGTQDSIMLSVKMEQEERVVRSAMRTTTFSEKRSRRSQKVAMHYGNGVRIRKRFEKVSETAYTKHTFALKMCLRTHFSFVSAALVRRKNHVSACKACLAIAFSLMRVCVNVNLIHC